MKYSYEINESNEIRVWDIENPNEENQPFFYQPNWPNGEQWSSKEEAEEWVLLFIASLKNSKSEYLAGDSPESPKKLRPQPKEKAI